MSIVPLALIGVLLSARENLQHIPEISECVGFRTNSLAIVSKASPLAKGRCRKTVEQNVGRYIRNL